jgi:predicted transcriptional regulator
MPKPKIDRVKLNCMLRAGKSQKEIAQVFRVSEAAVSKARKELSIAVIKNMALESASKVMDKNLDAISQLQKINNYANELLDLLMRWNRGDEGRRARYHQYIDQQASNNGPV